MPRSLKLGSNTSVKLCEAQKISQSKLCLQWFSSAPIYQHLDQILPSEASRQAQHQSVLSMPHYPPTPPFTAWRYQTDQRQNAGTYEPRRRDRLEPPRRADHADRFAVVNLTGRTELYAIVFSIRASSSISSNNTFFFSSQFRVSHATLYFLHTLFANQNRLPPRIYNPLCVRQSFPPPPPDYTRSTPFDRRQG